MDALGKGDLDAARALSNLPLTSYMATECARVWKMRASQILETPEDAPWVTRLLFWDGMVVGRAGFHGRPDSEGMVEVGYSVDPLHRRQGHARAAVEMMMDIARRDAVIRKVRASISPGNAASRALVEGFGFKEVGEEWDDEDGLEIVFEVDCVSVS